MKVKRTSPCMRTSSIAPLLLLVLLAPTPLVLLPKLQLHCTSSSPVGGLDLTRDGAGIPLTSDEKDKLLLLIDEEDEGDCAIADAAALPLVESPLVSCQKKLIFLSRKLFGTSVSTSLVRYSSGGSATGMSPVVSAVSGAAGGGMVRISSSASSSLSASGCAPGSASAISCTRRL
jgi:hypothetical protein